MSKDISIRRTEGRGRLYENISTLDFKLEQEDVDEITKIDEGHRICDNYEWLFNNSIFA